MSVTQRIVEEAPTQRELASLEFVKQVLRGNARPKSLAETRAVLLELAQRKAKHLPAELLVDQVLGVTEGTDWPTRRAAMDALLRRVGYAARDELVIRKQPARERVLGVYELAGRRPNEGETKGRRRSRPYRTELLGVAPLRGSCDCADYLRGSLGLCKHLLAVVDNVWSSKRKLARAEREQQQKLRDRPVLRWDPVRDWLGKGDRLSGLSLETPLLKTGEPAALRGKLGDWLRDGQPDSATLAVPERRAELLELLATALAKRDIEAESGARAVVEAETEVERRRLAAQREAPKLEKHLKSLNRTLYTYQLEGVRRLLSSRRLLLADDMGLGKTTQAIAACHALFCAGRVSRGLVIVPAALKSQWVREWEATTAKAPVALVEGTASQRNKIYRSTKQGFLVMNYEQLLRDLEAVHRFAPEVVVLDEAQRIKNWATKSSAYVMTLKPEWRLVLTGTPLENRLEELATILDWVDDIALTPKWRLVPWHTQWGAVRESERAGVRHLDTLRQRLEPSVVRRVRQEVLSQLPPRTDVRVPVEMTEPQRDEHESVRIQIAQLVQAALRHPLRQEQFLRLMAYLAHQRMASNGMALLRFDELWPTYSKSPADDALLATLASPKLVELRRLIRELVVDQGRKVVVFSQWRKMLKLAEWCSRDVLASRGMRAAFFTGGESQKLRTRNVVEFHDDPDVSVMFLSDAGGVGLNLQRAANACINLELPWNPAVLEQRVGRIYRMGQKLPIDVINLVCEEGIESRIALLVGQKKALFSGLFDGTTDEVLFDEKAGFLAELERLVEPVNVPVPEVDIGDGEDVEEPADGTEPEVRSAAAERELGSEAVESTSPPAEPAAVARAGNVTELFSQVRVERTDSGGLRIEAEPEAAGELANLLEGLAGLLRQASDRR